MKPRLNKNTFKLLALAISTLFFDGTVGADTEDVVHLTFLLSHYGEEERAVYLDAIERYNAEHPGVEVEAISGQGFVTNAHDTYIRFLALEDPSIDIYRLDLPWIPEFAYPEWLLRLGSYLPPEIRGEFVPAAFEGGEYLGEVYALPLALTGNLLYYRADLLDTYQLDPPDSIAELERQARFLQEQEGLPVGVALHGLYFYNDVFPFFWASGGEVVTERGEVQLDSPTNVQVLEALVSMVGDEPGSVLPLSRFIGEWSQNYRGPFLDFRNGDAAFLVSWSSRWELLQEPDSAVRGRVAAAPIPGLEPGGQGASNLGSWYIAANRFSRHPEAAADFVQYLASSDVQLERLERLGHIPSRQDLLDDPDLLRRFPRVESLHPVLATARARPRVPNEREIDGVVEDYLLLAMRGEMTPEAALTDAAREIERRLLPERRDDAASSVGVSWIAPASRSWRSTLVASAISIAVLILAVVLLMVVHARRPVRLLSTVRAKLVVFGTTLILVLMLAGAGFMSSHAMQAQQTELDASYDFYAQQLTAHARTLSKQLSLAASLLADSAGDEADEGSPSLISHLMLASHFTEDLLFLEFVDLSGHPIYTDRDLLVVGQSGDRFPMLENVAEQVRRRTISIEERLDAEGTPYVEMISPVFRHGVHHGAIRLGVSEQAYRGQLEETRALHEAEIARIYTFSTGLTVVLVVLGLVLIIGLSTRLTRPIVALTGSARRIREGDLDVEFTPAPSDEIGVLSATMAEMVQGLRDRDFVRDVLGRYVSPEMAGAVLSDPESLELGGRMQEVTIMMSDLRGFTNLSSILGPERMVLLLNRYLECMTDVILENRGTINEFIGDGILVVFGAPVALPDHAHRAVRCAVGMQQAMTAFNERSQELGVPELEMGIGLSTGSVVAGNIGSERRAKYGVVGPPVNMTGRIESLTIGGQILISETTFEMTKDIVDVGEPNSVQFKGRAEPMLVYELRGVDGEDGAVVPAYAEESTTEVEFQATWSKLKGKQVGASQSTGLVRQLGVNIAFFEVDQPLQPLDNLLLRIEMESDRWTSDVYAKVVSVQRGTSDSGEDAWTAELRFTSVNEADRLAFEALSGRET